MYDLFETVALTEEAETLLALLEMYETAPETQNTYDPALAAGPGIVSGGADVLDTVQGRAGSVSGETQVALEETGVENPDNDRASEFFNALIQQIKDMADLLEAFSANGASEDQLQSVVDNISGMKDSFWTNSDGTGAAVGAPIGHTMGAVIGTIGAVIEDALSGIATNLTEALGHDEKSNDSALDEDFLNVLRQTLKDAAHLLTLAQSVQDSFDDTRDTVARVGGAAEDDGDAKLEPEQVDLSAVWKADSFDFTFAP
ncbi:hypothetical protein CKO11_03225 [Rhodobacter sp. TJ_12]|uniref:hypothetical protein n=1 Tax=Rhodobacter sp. TJ_12 TaxID=2029399 RepID=UPI001CC0953D|nr:hypothetical protein [Rhodobacter sp. TJ_12]MBZ4021475.1 hypothetical protein [Rhodobacter sp. TJ_12]